ncbi:bifunctional diguanylate cyclase/phosphodiesterase [Rhizobium sp. SSA_523]|uniref:putative bifunctional diguanylate cyclase/phosphodiesterase n=1 Tax=Rhizobium sp. SSA_523 TaxID=2952477 RepID=UPI00209137E3|nr:bifunctional diguanylate cyclase/phosphodiesterase [Rhizobium sp. SSA_523]MCO5730409.1 EAL domain-containing protein [Rhizobium sp. SSA_523]WKC25453.1 EAL domain-containing protein [Rhizobium sp. SSA_523]
MLSIFTCLFTEHDPLYVGAAAILCVLGSYLTMRLFARALHAQAMERLVWTGLAGFVGGCAIWTTHFIAMLGYTGAGAAAYEPGRTLLSLLIAIGASTAGLAIAAVAGRSLLAEAGGAVLGLGISAMHYTGMAAYRISGSIVWDERYVVASVLLGGIFGAIAVNRIVHPLTRFCKYGGALALIFGIVLTHFTGMTGVRAVLLPVAEPVAGMLSSAILGLSVLTVMVMLLGLAASTYLLDAKNTMAAVARYRHLSLHDALTGLPNRSGFQEELNSLQERASRLPGKIALLSFDLNRFKEINDVHGHSAGDAVLQTLGTRLAAVLVNDEFLARVGGDEFVAVTRRYHGRFDATALANRLLAEISRPVEWEGHIFCVSSSVGISVQREPDMPLEEVLAQADVAMYRAKASGPNRVCFYDPSMDQAVRERNALAMDLRNALILKQLELFYQVQNDTQSGAVVGFEVLLRWNHPQRGRVPPSDFIPIAERTGLIIEIGEWVLRQACRQAASWAQPYGVAINVATQQLADLTLPAKVRQILQETGLAADRLELEITESGIIDDQNRALLIINQLKELGVKIAMDDYGTGYSSLSTLMRFPFDKIKIDRSFIDKVDRDAQSAAIVRSTLILAQSLNIPVLAEGVETEQHLDFLKREGCSQVQGFLYGRPVPIGDIMALVNPAEDLNLDAPLFDADALPLVSDALPLVSDALPLNADAQPRRVA